MKSAFLALFLLLLPPHAAALTPADLSAISSSPTPGARVPTAMRFLDERQIPTAIAPPDNHAPVLLLFVAYRCTYLCSVSAPMLAAALDHAGLRPGEDFRLVALSLDPRDTPAQARAFRAARLPTSSPAARAFTLLTGNARDLAVITHALGYSYSYDAANDLFAHDASVYVLTPTGKVARVLPEYQFQPDILRAALAAPDEGRPLTALAHTLCYFLTPSQGKYNRAILIGLQAGGALVLLAMALFHMRRRRRGK
jgi:protein SCO1/2